MSSSTPNVAGFNTWLELFEHIKAAKLQNENTVTLCWPSEPVEVNDDRDAPEKPEEKPDISVDMNSVRSQCFLELYENLPLPATMGFLLNLIEQSTMDDSDKKIFTKFLTKIPTRTQ